MSQINKSLSALENIVELIKEVHPGSSLTSSQVTLGAVTAATGENYNTEIVVNAVENAGFRGSRTFKYTRLGLDQASATRVESVEVLPADTEAEVAAKVAAALNLIEGEFTTSAFTAPANESTNGSVTLTANADSVFYAGEPVTITLTAADTDQDMEAAFPNDTLSGFDQPVSPA